MIINIPLDTPSSCLAYGTHCHPYPPPYQPVYYHTLLYSAEDEAVADDVTDDASDEITLLALERNELATDPETETTLEVGMIGDDVTNEAEENGFELLKGTAVPLPVALAVPVEQA